MNLNIPLTPSPIQDRPVLSAIKHYAYGCFAKSWNGATVAAWSFVTQAAGSGLYPQKIAPPTWEYAANTFLIVAVIQMLGYFKDHPLPDRLPETKAPFPTITEVKGGAIITTPVEDKK